MYWTGTLLLKWLMMNAFWCRATICNILLQLVPIFFLKVIQVCKLIGPALASLFPTAWTGRRATYAFWFAYSAFDEWSVNANPFGESCRFTEPEKTCDMIYVLFYWRSLSKRKCVQEVCIPFAMRLILAVIWFSTVKRPKKKLWSVATFWKAALRCVICVLKFTGLFAAANVLLYDFYIR